MKGNPQSSRFWQKCGFVETGIEKENEHGVAVAILYQWLSNTFDNHIII